MTGRIFERKRRQMPCTLTLDGRNHGGLILDLSPGGLYIQSSAKIKPGDQLEIRPVMAILSQPMLRFTGPLPCGVAGPPGDLGSTWVTPRPVRAAASARIG